MRRAPAPERTIGRRGSPKPTYLPRSKVGERRPLTGRSPTEERAAHPRSRQRSRAAAQLSAVDVPSPGACALPGSRGRVPARGTVSTSPCGTLAPRHCGEMAPLDAREAAPRRRWQRCRSQGGPQGPDPTDDAAARRARGAAVVSYLASVARPWCAVAVAAESDAAGSCAALTTGRELQTLPSSDRPATTRNPAHPRPEVLHGSVRMGLALGGECPALGRGRAAAHERPGAHGACARGAMRDARHQILQSTEQPCAGSGRQVRMGRALGPGYRCGRQCSRGRPRRVAGCAWGVRSGRTAVTRQRIPESTDHECVGWSTAGCG